MIEMDWVNIILIRKSSIKKIFIVYIVCLLLVSFFPIMINITTAASENEEIYCEVSDDSFVKSSEKSTNYGHWGTISVQHLGSGETRSFIKFDLPEIPEGSTIVSAILDLCISGTNSDPTGNKIDCHQILSSWDEETINWYSMPSWAGITDSDYVPSSPHFNKWMQWNVTGDINHYYNINSGRYNGWLLKIAEPTDGGVYFSTKEYSNEELRPNLTIVYEPPNQPPYTPSAPTGPSNLNTGQTGTYSTSATDPDGDQVQYRFDWDDGTISTWTNLVNSGTTASKDHQWTTPGTYNVKAQTRDEHLATSTWSNSKTVVISEVPNNNPHTPNPVIDETDVSVNTDLSWSYSETFDTFNVYFGTDEDDLSIIANTQDFTFDLDEPLNYSTTYYWQVEAEYQGNTIMSELWYFTTESSITLLHINYSDPRCCYKEGDQVRIYANSSDPPPFINLDITIKNSNNEILNDSEPMNSDYITYSWYFDWNAPSGNNGQFIVFIKKCGTENYIIWDASKYIDNTIPTINGLVNTTSNNSATIYWTAEESANCTIKYGLTNSYENSPKTETTYYEGLHDISISDLLTNKTYHYKLITYDEAGNTNESEDQTFSTKTDEYYQNISQDYLLPPIANAGGPYEGFINETITFNGSRSISPNGTIMWYKWDFENDGRYDTIPMTNDPLYYHKYSKVGNYTIKLHVQDEFFEDTNTSYVNIKEKTEQEIDNLTEGNISIINITETLDTIVINVEITPIENIPDAKLSIIDHGDYKPENIEKKPVLEDLQEDSSLESSENLSIFRYVDISLQSNNTNVNETIIGQAFIFFWVEKTWIYEKDNEINKSTIKMIRYYNNSWQNLNTLQIGEDDDFYYYTTETPGFSTFAVVGSKVVETGTESTNNDQEIPWIIIIGFIISAIIILIFVIFKTKLIYIGENPEEK